jgi:hypothetical protein
MGVAELECVVILGLKLDNIRLAAPEPDEMLLAVEKSS